MNISQLSSLLSRSQDRKNTVSSADRLNEIVRRVMSADGNSNTTEAEQARCINVPSHRESFKEMVDKYL